MFGDQTLIQGVGVGLQVGFPSGEDVLWRGLDELVLLVAVQIICVFTLSSRLRPVGAVFQQIAAVVLIIVKIEIIGFIVHVE